MYIEFDEMPATARVWIYQSNTKLDSDLIKMIELQGQAFCENWEAHGQPLKSTFKVFHDQFLVISVDESYNMASGCSIDKSVELVRNLESRLGVSFFDRTNIAFLKEDEVFLKPMYTLKKEISAGAIDRDTVTFNNLVQNIGEMKEKWQVPVGDSWLNRYFA